MQSVGEQSIMLGREGGLLRVCYWLTLVSGLVECLCFAGAVFGWASLTFVLKSDGYFSYLCVNRTVNGTITEGKLCTYVHTLDLQCKTELHRMGNI